MCGSVDESNLLIIVKILYMAWWKSGSGEKGDNHDVTRGMMMTMMMAARQ